MSIPLKWPPDFPPRSGARRFFAGVPWLGPDLSFFHELRDLQAQRTESCMTAWLDDSERALALRLGRHLSEAIGWGTPYFLPDDELRAIACGPRFQTVDDLLYEEAIIAIERDLGMSQPDAYWSSAAESDFGRLVCDLRKRFNP